MPRRSDEILHMLPSGWPAEEVLAKLASPDWKLREDLVSSSNLEGGSAGTFGRFLETEDWFLKASLRRRYPSVPEAFRAETETEQLRQALEIYHPERLWFLSLGTDAFLWACSLTPKLDIVRQALNDAPARPESWALYYRCCRLTLDIYFRAGVTLDCNPNNFGVCPAGRIYYVDDDLSAPATLASQALLRLREYRQSPLETRVAFAYKFCSLLLNRSREEMRRFGLAKDLRSNPFLPEEKELRQPFVEVQKWLQGAK